MKAQGTADYELDPIRYSQVVESNVVSALSFDQKSPGNGGGGAEKRFLQAVLHQLQVHAGSQVLVFSRTSLQRRKISPTNPRALYFNDDTYVGWVPGGLIELTTSDPQLGLAFYSLDPNGTAPFKPQRDNDCLSCHGGGFTGQWPGVFVRSVVPDERGEPITYAGSTLVGHETPFSERWGGWYVTGEHGSARHMGNVFATESNRVAHLDREAGANISDLNKYFDTSRYLADGSDVVALMVLEHQVNMHNRLAQGSLRARKWMHYQQQLQKELGEPVLAYPSGTALRVIESEAEKIVEYLLFASEAPVPEGGLKPADSFKAAFATNAIYDSKGRSLKEFDLATRLFRYRCSYMIYSRSFNELFPALKEEVYRKLHQALVQGDKRGKHLPAAERLALHQIIGETKKDLPPLWKETSPTL